MCSPGWIRKIIFLTAAAAFVVVLPGAILPADEDPPPPPEPEKVLALITTYVSDLEGSAAKGGEGGLKLSAVLLPDARAYRIAKEYLRLRKMGKAHAAVVQEMAVQSPRWNLRRDMAGVWLKIENSNPRPGDPRDLVKKQRIFTLQENLAKKAVILLGKGGKRIPLRLAEAPLNLREVQLRVKKFWTTSDRRTRRGAYDPQDPASIGRVPKLSKPFTALLLEERPAEAELLFRLKDKKKPPRTLILRGFKQYEGPFRENQLDLNLGRRWDPVDPITVELRLPPGGQAQPSALAGLIQEVNQAAGSK